MTFGCNPQINFYHVIRSSKLVIFGLKAFRHCVSYKRNSSYSFNQIFLKLCRSFCQGLKMCMMFGCNPQISFYHVIRSSNLVIFGLKAFRHCVSYKRNSSYSFNQIFLKHCRSFCQGLKMCMIFGCNPQINFYHVIRSSNLVIFGLKAFRHCVSYKRNSSYSFNQIFLKHYRCFFQGLKICLSLAVILKLIFVTFFGV